MPRNRPAVNGLCARSLWVFWRRRGVGGPGFTQDWASDIIAGMEQGSHEPPDGAEQAVAPSPSAESLDAFTRAHPAPDHQSALRLRRLGNRLIALAVAISALAVVVWIKVPLGSGPDRLLAALLPLLALMGVVLRRVHGDAVTWVEGHPDPYGLEDEALRDFFGVNRFDTALSWLMIPGLTLLARTAFWYRAENTGLGWLLEAGLWIVPIVLVIPSGFAGYWAGTRHRRRWLYRGVSLGWTSLVLLGAVWGVNVVFTTDPGTPYIATVARDFHPSGYDAATGYATPEPPLYIRPFPAAPRGFAIVDPIVLWPAPRAGTHMRIVISRGALGLRWLRSYEPTSSSGSAKPVRRSAHRSATKQR